MKISVSKKKLLVHNHIVVDMLFLNFAIEYLRENKKFAKPFLPVHLGSILNLLSKNMVENLMTLSL